MFTDSVSTDEIWPVLPHGAVGPGLGTLNYLATLIYDAQGPGNQKSAFDFVYASHVCRFFVLLEKFAFVSISS